MNVIRPNCRAHFTPSDLAFVGSVVGLEQDAHVIIEQHHELLDDVLDSRKIFLALLERPACLRVSSHLYFYVLVRHVLLENGIDDRTLADYVAEVLAEFSSADKARRPLAPEDGAYDYMVDLLTAIRDNADDQQRQFLLRAHVGNLSLFLSGVFSKHLEHRARVRAAPEIGFYEQVGMANYRTAGEHPLAERYDVAPVFQTLSRTFRETRVALNDLSERLIFLGEV
jgi:hypothetical protein